MSICWHLGAILMPSWHTQVLKLCLVFWMPKNGLNLLGRLGLLRTISKPACASLGPVLRHLGLGNETPREPKGPREPSGSRGPRRPRGPKGPRGPRRSKGPRRGRGPRALRGPRGPRGPSGQVDQKDQEDREDLWGKEDQQHQEDQESQEGQDDQKDRAGPKRQIWRGVWCVAGVVWCGWCVV